MIKDVTDLEIYKVSLNLLKEMRNLTDLTPLAEKNLIWQIKSFKVTIRFRHSDLLILRHSEPPTRCKALKTAEKGRRRRVSRLGCPKALKTILIHLEKSAKEDKKFG